MLKIELPAVEYFDDATETFVEVAAKTLYLEHSLVSISKWESKYEKPFLVEDQKSQEELHDYVMYMILNENPSRDDVVRLSQGNYEEVLQYMRKKNSATTFHDDKTTKGSREIQTSELIYFWMIEFGIPIECENWNINRLFALIKVCVLKKNPPKKMTRNQIAQRNRELNARRKAELGTTG